MAISFVQVTQTQNLSTIGWHVFLRQVPLTAHRHQESVTRQFPPISTLSQRERGVPTHSCHAHVKEFRWETPDKHCVILKWTYFLKIKERELIKKLKHSYLLKNQIYMHLSYEVQMELSAILKSLGVEGPLPYIICL